MKSRCCVRVVVLAIALASPTSTLDPTCATAGEFFPYRSEAGRFSVDFPGGAPTVSELIGTQFSLTDNDFNYAVVSDGVEFSVEIHDIPRLARLVLTSRYILEHSVSGKLEDVHARELDSAQTSFQGQPAREIVFEAMDRSFTGRMLVVLAEDRLYLVGALHPPSLDPQDSIARFLGSFSFWLE